MPFPPLVFRPPLCTPSSIWCVVRGRTHFDVFFGRILQGLPGPLKDALTAAELDSPAVLLEYPRSSAEELRGILHEDGGTCLAPSGGASSRTASITYGHPPRVRGEEWSEKRSGDPRTDGCSLGHVMDFSGNPNCRVLCLKCSST